VQVGKWVKDVPFVNQRGSYDHSPEIHSRKEAGEQRKT
jgi:hypothetical protein